MIYSGRITEKTVVFALLLLDTGVRGVSADRGTGKQLVIAAAEGAKAALPAFNCLGASLDQTLARCQRLRSELG